LIRGLISLFEPLGLVWITLIGYAVWLYRRSRQRECALVGGLAGFIWLVGATPLTALMLASLERPYAGLDFDRIPQADAVVLLGGGSTASPHEASGMHLTETGDRVLMAYELMLARKAPRLLIGGGTLEEGDVQILLSESTLKWFANGKVAREKLIALPHSRNTFDEAVHTRNIAATNGWKRILLVTSAAHMRRAAATFRTQGLEVFEVPCNFQTLAGQYGNYAVTLAPRTDGFDKFSNFLHEELGWIYYRLRGRIDSAAAAQKTPFFKR